MNGETADLDARFDALTRRLEAVERRLAALERPAGTEAAAPEQAPEPEFGVPSELLPLSGRTLVVLGGAFLLRAVTEAGVVPRGLGTGLGLAYALIWVGLADRAAAANRRLSATFHGLVGTAIALALLWEATVNFEFLSARTSALALGIFAALALTVVVRRKLRGLGWVVVLGTTLAALALAVPTRVWVSHVFVVLGLAFVMLWIGHERPWRAMAWVLSGLVAGVILLMTATMLFADFDRVTELFHPDSLLAIQLCWVVIFFGTMGYRTFVANDDVTIGEMVMGFVAFAVGFGGATAITRSGLVHNTSLAVISLALAAGSYGVAFQIADRRSERRRNFAYYSTLALLVTLVASGTLLQGSALVFTLALVALGTAWLGATKSRATLSLHAAVYVICAAVASGMLGHEIEALAGPVVPDFDWISLPVLAVLATAGVFFWLPVASHGRTWGRFSRAPKLAVTIVLFLGVGAIAIVGVDRLLALSLGSAAGAPVVASVRTGVLALAAVALAWLGRKPRWPEASWLVYPVLVLGGLKLLMEDVRVGGPATLFFSFVLYGAAMILAPRLVRRAE